MYVFKSLFLWILLCQSVLAMTADEVLLKLEDKEVVFLDTRNEDAYNGWKFNDAVRTGHIPNALSFPIDFMKRIQDNDPLLQLLQSKKEVIVYGNNVKEASLIATFLQSKKINVQLLGMDFNQYAQNEQLPLVTLPNYQLLVPAKYIKQRLDTKAKFRLFEVSWGNGISYEKAHIPSAVHIDTNEVEEAPFWNYKSAKALKQFALNYGIQSDVPVILYGADNMASFRVAVILMAMGVEDVRVLNGGFRSWVKAGFKTEEGNTKPKKVTSFNSKFFQNASMIVKTSEVEETLKNKTAQVISIRTKDEYDGTSSGYSYINTKGHIKGAIWGNSGRTPFSMDAYRSLTHKMASSQLIQQRWKSLGIDVEKPMILSCTRGWRASEVYFYAKVMGIDNIALYDGSWLQWSANAKRPIEILTEEK
jgi:thiosulfate/3-mercaptopyruvate sulfurtransferase